MPQLEPDAPRSHRQEAERLLKHAEKATGGSAAGTAALVGIGHALLAVCEEVRGLRLKLTEPPGSVKSADRGR